MSTFFKSVEDDVVKAGRNIANFQKKFPEIPMYALQWADSVFHDAVTAQLGKEVLKWNRSISATELKDVLAEKVISLASSQSTSTSPSHNLISLCELEFWAKMADKLKWYPHVPEVKQ